MAYNPYITGIIPGAIPGVNAPQYPLTAPPLTGFQKISQALQGIASLENKPLEHLSKLAGAAPQLYGPAYASALQGQADPSRDLDRQVKEAQLFRLLNPTADPSQAVELQIQQLKLGQLEQEGVRNQQRARILSGQAPALSPTGINPAAGPVNAPLFDSAPLNVRNNNPGNLRPVGSDTGFQQFSSPEEGLQALSSDLTAKLSGNSPIMQERYGANYVPTLNNVISTWAPPSENDTQSYINNVAEWTGIDPNQPLTPNDVSRLAPAIIRQEGGGDAVQAFTNDSFSAPPVNISSAQMMPSQGSAPQIPFIGNPAIQQYQAIVDAGLDTADGQYAARLAEMKGEEATRLQTYLGQQAQNAPKPLTSVGQLKQDYDNGFITKEDYEAGKLKAQKEARDAADAIQKSKDTVSSQISGAKNVLSAIDNSLKLAGDETLGFNFSTGLAGQILSNVGGRDAYDLKKSIDTIQASLSFDKLQEMRNNSPTGGALGSIAVRELDLLGATIASLDNAQSQEQVIANLGKVKEHYNNWLKTVDPSFKPPEQILEEEKPSTGVSGPLPLNNSGWSIKKK